MFYKKLLANILALISCVTLGLAQSTPTPTPTPEPSAPQVLPETVVSAKPESLTNPSISSLREKMEQIPGAAEVIDAETYKGGRATTVKDALEAVVKILRGWKFTPAVITHAGNDVSAP